MAQTIKLTATDGSTVEFVDEVIGSGAMKDVYFSPDKSYVVGFFRTPQDANAKDRLTHITGIYRERIFNQVGGEYWKNLFCWPTKMVNGMVSWASYVQLTQNISSLMVAGLRARKKKAIGLLLLSCAISSSRTTKKEPG